MIVKNYGYKIWQAIQTTYGYAKALVDDSIKGALRSIGDAGASPLNTTGKTLLQLNTDILSKQGTQLRDFYIDTETPTIPSGSIWYIRSGDSYPVKNSLTGEGKIAGEGKLIIIS
mgnify:CR=1 FL=1